MHFEFIEDVSESKWEKIVRGSEGAYFFHTPMWANILEHIYGYKTATCLYEIDGVEILVPMMKLKWRGFYNYVSMPMGYGGIFSMSEISPYMIELIFNHIKQRLSGRSLVFWILFHPFSDISIPININPYIISVESDLHYTHILPLRDEFENIWKYKFTHSARNRIKKAEKSGVEVFLGTKASDYESYYKIYLDSVNRWKSDHYYPLNFFMELLKYRDNVKLWLASLKDDIIGGLIAFEYGNNIIGFAQASLSNFWNYAPNNLLFKYVIEYANQKGFKYFDFGRSGNLLGVRRFKETFGAELVKLRKYVIFSRLGRLGNIFLRKY